MLTVRFHPEVHDDGVFATERDTGELWHRVDNRVLYADTDRADVVYHANYLRYFEVGRTALLRAAGYPYKEIEASGFVHPIVDLAVAFHQRLQYDDPMWIYTRPVELLRVKLTFHYRILHGETDVLVASGHTTHACLNRKGIPVAMDPSSVALCARFGVTGP